MRRVTLTEGMVRRIEEALDERKHQRRSSDPLIDYPADRRAAARGRRASDHGTAVPGDDAAGTGARQP